MAQYFYSENGQSRGPFSAQQLKEFVQAGKIQPETMVWKEGNPQWAPARSYKGLLPANEDNCIREMLAGPTAMMPPSEPMPIPDQEQQSAPAGLGRLWLLLGGIGTGLLALAALVFLLLNSGQEKNPAKGELTQGKPSLQEPDPDEEPSVDEKRGQSGAPRKTREQPKPEEMPFERLLEKYKENPEKTLKDYKKKKVILLFNGRWNIDGLKKLVIDGNLEILLYTSIGDVPNFNPNGAVLVTFPNVDPKSKLGFFAKIKEYAEKRTKGEIVAMRILGTMSTSSPPDPRLQKGTYLHLQEAELLDPPK